MKIKIETEKEYKIVDKLIEKYMLSDNLNILEDVLRRQPLWDMRMSADKLSFPHL
jgi:hypothetical protein